MKRIFGALLVLALAVGLCTTSWAAEDTYLDAAGTVQDIPAGFTTVTQDNIPTADPWPGGWYVIRGSVTIDKVLKLDGEVNLVLTDGCELKVGGICSVGLTPASYCTLTVYGQRGGSGKLTINGGYDWVQNPKRCAGIYGDVVVINGGIITITAAPGGEQSWGTNVDSITVNGGTIKATGGEATDGSVGIYGTNVRINGGIVTATASNSGRASAGLATDVSIVITGGTITASGSGSTGESIRLFGNNPTFTPPNNSGYWWRTAKGGAYNTQDAWDADTSIEGAYMELTTTDPTPVKHYYYVPTETEEAVEAPKTADPGVAVYGVMAVSALLGMGVVKKKAF